MTESHGDELFVYGLWEDGAPLLSDAERRSGALAKRARRERVRTEERGDTLGVAYRVDRHRLASTGWAVVFPGTWSQARVDRVRDALEPLLARRREEAGELYLEARYAGQDLYVWLAVEPTMGSLLTPVRPGRGRLPYYVLLVGGPADLSFDLQYRLAIQYAVGRLCFDHRDEAAESRAYRRYAESVVAHERREVDAAAPSLRLMGTCRRDRAEIMAWKSLITPVAREFAVEAVELQSERLLQYLGARRSPETAVLFTASHGAAFHDPDEARQNQGALVCSDQRFGGAMVRPEWDLGGLMQVHFACHSAGHAEPPGDGFVAPLARALLSVPEQTPLAFVGHVGKAWSSSFLDYNVSASPPITAHFEEFLGRLCEGWRVGAAFDQSLTTRRNVVSSALTQDLAATGKLRALKPEQELRLAHGWTAETDARCFIIVGDPAARLRPPQPAGP